MWNFTIHGECFCKVTKGKTYVKHCRYFFNENPAGSLPLLYLLGCLLGAAAIQVGVADCSFPAMAEETGSGNTARQVCKYAFYGCRDLCCICVFKGDGELEVVVIVSSNRCFSCVDSRSEKGEQLPTICLCLNILSAFFTLEVYSFTWIKAHPPWVSHTSRDSGIISCHCFSSYCCLCAPPLLQCSWPWNFSRSWRISASLCLGSSEDFFSGDVSQYTKTPS